MIAEGRIEVGFNPAKKRKKMNIPPCTPLPVFFLHPPWPYCKAISPPPPHNSCSSTSTTAPRLLPATVVLSICHRTFVDCCFLLLLLALLAPLCHWPSATSLQLPLSSTSSAAILHLTLPSPLVCHCTCCALVDCCLLLLAAPLLPLRIHSCCLSIVICHVVCRGATLCMKTNSDLPRYFIFESYLKIKENIISTASISGRIGVGLHTYGQETGILDTSWILSPNPTLGVIEVTYKTNPIPIEKNGPAKSTRPAKSR